MFNIKSLRVISWKLLMLPFDNSALGYKELFRQSKVKSINKP